MVEPERRRAPGLRLRIWTLLGKGMENLKKEKNEMLETGMVSAIVNKVNSSLHVTTLLQAGGILFPLPTFAQCVLDRLFPPNGVISVYLSLCLEC